MSHFEAAAVAAAASATTTTASPNIQIKAFDSSQIPGSFQDEVSLKECMVRSRSGSSSSLKISIDLQPGNDASLTVLLFNPIHHFSIFLFVSSFSFLSSLSFQRQMHTRPQKKKYSPPPFSVFFFGSHCFSLRPVFLLSHISPFHDYGPFTHEQGEGNKTERR